MGWRKKQELNPSLVQHDKSKELAAQDLKSIRKERWFFGGLSSALAVFVTHPLDTIKVQLQTQEGNIGVLTVTKNIINSGGNIRN